MAENMLLFGKICVPQMFTVRSPDFHFEIARYLHDPAFRRLNIIAPRGHGKSSILGAIYPLHHLFFGDKGQKFIVLVSKTEGHAIKLLETIKDILNYSTPLRTYFGYHGMMVSSAWKSTEIVLDTGDVILTRGTGQMVVGLKHLNQRPTLIILDDPEDMTNTKTAEAMEYNLRWMLQSLYPALDPSRGRIVVIGTPQHQRCIVETLREAPGWTTLKYKALQESGEALWPEWWPKDRLEEERANAEGLGRVSMFYREFQCEVVGDEDQLFREKDIRYYEGTLSFNNRDGESFLRLTKLGNESINPPQVLPVNVFMGVDPASSVSRSADYSTIVSVAVDSTFNR